MFLIFQCKIFEEYTCIFAVFGKKIGTNLIISVSHMKKKESVSIISQILTDLWWLSQTWHRGKKIWDTLGVDRQEELTKTLYRKVELRVKAIWKYKAKSSIYLRAIKGWNLYVSFLTVSKEMNQSQLQPSHPNYHWGHQQINNLSSLRNLIDYRYIFTFFLKAVDQN